MVQANLLLPVSGKMPDSFGVMDLMRLPLGILTGGVGFHRPPDLDALTGSADTAQA